MQVKLSRVIHGIMRIKDWGYSLKEFLDFIHQLIDIGVTTFDLADIYGDYEAQEIFGRIFEIEPSLRKKVQIISKTGIVLLSQKKPQIYIKHYDTSKKHILKSVERTLKDLRTDYLDVLLIHRPDPLMNPEEISEAFEYLRENGLVLTFGVSNFNPHQMSLIKSKVKEPILYNQIEISPLQVNPFFDGTLDYCLEKNIIPMAWSPVAGGRIFKINNERNLRVLKALKKVAENHGTSVEHIIYAFLYKHPSKIYPVVGSGKFERVKVAVEALELELDRQEWFYILKASTGYDVP
ncbi:aldo/keto reductase [Thermosipho atlanticus]|uniref:Predicted oxidoreductase n=1 Tax=Thermosipho atlanticus DSM 15807 TaxID=1123380 RepID=A0A1M5TPE6_9BACT|nr:aldo/keto reductase [Thermosipho atlanticus]SHH52263.1 Predicted oxidoreductase [Thermosipho atlanticus DSM 15807]